MSRNFSSEFLAKNSLQTANETLNITVEDCLSADSTAERIVKALAYFVVLLVALVGNILVILVIYKNKQPHKSVNYFVFNMAVSDLFTPLTIMPVKIVEIISGSPAFMADSPLMLGYILCKLCYFLPDVSVIVSVESLLLISMDRLVAVVFPLKTKLISSKVRVICILCTWIIATAVYAPYFYTFRLFPYGNGSYVCEANWGPSFDHVETHKKYTTAVFITFILLPICFLVVAYGTMALTLKRKQNQRKKMSSSHLRRGYQQNRQFTRLSVAIIIAFVVCMVPLFGFTFTRVFLWNWREPPICAFRTVIPFIALFMLCSWSAVNPCICFIFSMNYRTGLKEILSYQEGTVRTSTEMTTIRKRVPSSPANTGRITTEII